MDRSLISVGIGASSAFVLQNALTAPVPSTWGMMLLGFAGLGWAGYRQRHKLAALRASEDVSNGTAAESPRRPSALSHRHWRPIVSAWRRPSLRVHAGSQGRLDWRVPWVRIAISQAAFKARPRSAPRASA